MLERISKLIKSKKISASQFADEIGVQRSSVSHVLSGRNKPSLDFITKIIDAYPEISTTWLLKGVGSMYVDDSTPDGANHEAEGQTSMKLDNENQPKEDFIEDIPPAPGKKTARKRSDGGSRTINKVVILYEDGTFEEYSRS